MSRRYMPTGNQQGFFTWSVKAVPQGVIVHFGKTGGSPAFMVNHASFVSEAEPETRRGKVSGQVANLNTDPSVCNCLTTLEVRGDFPESGLQGAHLSAILDHTKLSFREAIRLTIDHLTLDDWELMGGRELGISTGAASGALSLQADFDDEVMRVEGDLAMQAGPLVAKSAVGEFGEEMQEIFRKVGARIKTFRVELKAEGVFERPNLNVSSELGQAFATAFRQSFGDRLTLMSRMTRRSLTDHLDAKRQEFLKRLASAEHEFSRP
jgi:uncharacterized protein (TIGR03545 family)